MRHFLIHSLINIELAIMFSFSVVAGSCISYTVEHRAEEIEARAVMVNLMSHSLKELGEIQTRSL